MSRVKQGILYLFFHNSNRNTQKQEVLLSLYKEHEPPARSLADEVVRVRLEGGAERVAAEHVRRRIELHGTIAASEIRGGGSDEERKRLRVTQREAKVDDIFLKRKGIRK